MESVVLRSYADVERAVEALVEEEFFNGAFLQTLGAGAYSYAQIRHFALQYAYYSRNFPRVLGAAISAMPPIDTWWVPIADNLWDEAGRGEPGRAHEKLYLTFLRSVVPDARLDANGIPDEPMSPAVQKAIDTFIDFFRHASPLQAMAAVGLGSEMFAGAVMGRIGQYFQHPAYNRDRVIDVRFWQVHADEHEPRHYQLCKDVLQSFTSPDDLKTMYETGKFIAQSEARMYQELHEEMMRLEG
ncbi:TenA family transcriptional regulator [Alicyclobacillus macrosporangiidus]|uniref:Pyrroloquinoline quinone (PQQ) biosynthesis protein C n=1 Tax=Alicyclobacillus macrosporangiidus TaxID=392015 RepID=A0A1I7JND8_9BACL|nr:iron-containing redox enzyme family protein [Alicyclobacillus macrosporangiidus]SFU86691.1 Pyrroloquinoline quinone (PQQ) biosynthesis protein C [Alicyclobacillus macrosporangiidus]